jgi:molecular chaperone DnaJ
MRMEQKDLYKILGVSENATAEEIKKRYRKLAKQYHPDKHPGDAQAEAKFKEISEAASILTDLEKRKQYDQMRQYAAAGFGGGGFDPGQFRQQQGGFGGGADFGGFGSFGDIFSTIFGDGFGAEAGSGTIPRRGKDIHGSISVDFDEAIAGTKKTITISGPQACQVCKGTGAEPSAESTTCPECGGAGQVSFAQGAFAIKRTCPRCMGRGRIIGKPCSACGGSGSAKQKRKLAVKIPAGVENGTPIRLAGQGAPGSGGAPAGDLILTVHVGTDRYFDRRGRNVHTTAKINLAQALLGAKIDVRTLDGHAALKVPPGTGSGTVFRLKGLGVQVNGGRGDHLVKVDVEMPDDLTVEEKDLIRKLAESRGWDTGQPDK